MRGLLSARLGQLVPPLGRLETQLIEDPAFINVFIRWIVWFMAFLIVQFKAAPPDNLNNANWLLVVTFVLCTITTAFGSFIRPYLPEIGLVRILDYPAFTSSLDIVLSCMAVSFTGGWGSPFYEFALTSVIAPSLRFGTRGAFASAALYSSLYIMAVRFSRNGHGLDAVTTFGVVDGGFFSAVINPFMVAVLCAYLAEVVQRLHQERQRSSELAAQEERGRIAREIHDGIAQHIYMLTLNLEACAELAHRPRETADANLGERLDTLIQLSKHALWEVRHYIFDLKPHLAGERGLCGTIANQVREFEAITGLKVELIMPQDERAVAVATSAALIRIVQEALANVFKHAHARHLLLSIRFHDDWLQAEVLDDGVGFNPTRPPHEGYGLHSLQERAREVGGSLQIQSAPEVGTRVLVQLPMAGPPATRRGARPTG